MYNLLIFFFLISSLSFGGSASSKETWKIASLDWQPYSGEKLTNQGESVEKLRRILAKENITLEVNFFPWKRAMDFAKTEEYIGYFPAWPEEVIDGFVPTMKIDNSKIALLTYKNKSIKTDTLENLFKNNKIGIVKTYVYPKLITDLVKKYPHNITGALNETLLMKMLARKRFAIAITDPRVLNFVAKKEGMEKVSILKIIMEKELVISMRDDLENAKRILRINQLLKKQ